MRNVGGRAAKRQQSNSKVAAAQPRRGGESQVFHLFAVFSIRTWLTAKDTMKIALISIVSFYAVSLITAICFVSPFPCIPWFVTHCNGSDQPRNTRNTRNRKGCTLFPVFIQHSAFRIQHLNATAFIVPHSAFRFQNSAFRILPPQRQKGPARGFSGRILP
jgi:hypothetical protein